MSTASKHWVTAACLSAFAAQQLKTGCDFNADQLKGWAGLSKPQVKNAIETLSRWSFITTTRELKGDGSQLLTYQLTREGHVATQAAAAGAQYKSGPKGYHSKDRALPADCFALKLWGLVRQRKIVDSETLTSTLIDAGDQGQFVKSQRTVAKYLNRWASTGAIALSKQITSSRCKRFVLVTDSVEPPLWTPKAQARKASA